MKRFAMKEFGKASYDKVAYISFYNNKRMTAVFEMDYDINRILMAFKVVVSKSATTS